MEMLNYTTVPNAEMYAQYASAAYIDLIQRAVFLILTAVVGLALMYRAYLLEKSEEYLSDLQSLFASVGGALGFGLILLAVIGTLDYISTVVHHNSNKDAYINNYIIKHMPAYNVKVN